MRHTLLGKTEKKTKQQLKKKKPKTKTNTAELTKPVNQNTAMCSVAAGEGLTASRRQPQVAKATSLSAAWKGAALSSPGPAPARVSTTTPQN